MCAILLGPLVGTNLDKQILGRAAKSWETVKAVQPVDALGLKLSDYNVIDCPCVDFELRQKP